MRAYSLDLRQKIVEAYDDRRGTQRQIADTFGVSRAFVQNLLRRRRTTGSIAPLPHGGGSKPALDENDRETVRCLVKEQPDATLGELCEAVDEQMGVRVSLSTMCTVLKRMGLPRKKSRSRPMNGTAPGSRKHERPSERKPPSSIPVG